MVLRRFAAVLSCSLLAVAACNDAGPPPVAPATMAAAPVTTVVLDAGPAIATTSDAAAPPTAPSASPAPSSAPSASNDNGPDFVSCTADTDCTAVPKVGCCQNGFLEPVNKQSVSAYRASFTCGQKRPMCPMYRIVDKRLPVCNATSHKCELLQPDQFTCSSGGANAHACAPGSQCDSSGHCARTP